MGLIFFISSFEVDVPGVRHLPFRDKAIHFIEFGILGWLAASASSRTWPAAPSWKTTTFAVFVSVLWGLSDEIHQAMVPGRTAEFADLVADLLGSVAGAVGRSLISGRSVS